VQLILIYLENKAVTLSSYCTITFIIVMPITTETPLTVEQLTKEFERSGNKLRSYLLRITASAADAEDIAQDTFVKAVDHLSSFRMQSSVPTWLFAIATNLAKDNLRARKRWVEHVTDVTREAALGNASFLHEALNIRSTSPQGQFEIREHIAFCFTCVAKSLPLEHQVTLLLKEVYEFKVAEIALIIDTTEAMVKYYLRESRSKMIEIFDGRCSLINKQGACHQCSELNGLFNPKQNFQEEAMKIDLVQQANKAGKAYLFDLRMKILRGIDPFESNSAELQLFHLQHNRKVMETYLEKNKT